MSGLAPVDGLPLRAAHILLILFIWGNMVSEHFEYYETGFYENALENVDSLFCSSKQSA